MLRPAVVAPLSAAPRASSTRIPPSINLSLRGVTPTNYIRASATTSGHIRCSADHSGALQLQTSACCPGSRVPLVGVARNPLPLASPIGAAGVALRFLDPVNNRTFLRKHQSKLRACATVSTLQESTATDANLPTISAPEPTMSATTATAFTDASAPLAASDAAASTATTAADRAAAKAAAKAAAAAAYAASGAANDGLRTKRPAGHVKRCVAMHVGYVGTAFNGLQINRISAPGGPANSPATTTTTAATAASSSTGSSSLPETVEGLLERAVYDAGLIAESNFGDLKKVKWTRSSRTDKGVHSVSTVVGLRVLLAGDERFDTDPEGLTLAAALNRRLPREVRVFSVQRVNKKFNARRFCFDRTYEYFLPAHLLLPDTTTTSSTTSTATTTNDATAALGTPEPQSLQSHVNLAAGGAQLEGQLRQEQGQEPEQQPPQSDQKQQQLAAALGRLRAALSCFQGTHPFHNYTARRREYVQSAREREARKAARAAAAAQSATQAAAAAACGTATDAADADADAVISEAATATDATADAAATAAAGVVLPSVGAAAGARKLRKEEEEPLEEEEDEEGEEGEEAEEEEYDTCSNSDSSTSGRPPSTWIQTCHWLHDNNNNKADSRDRVTVRHFRTISSFTADDPEPLVPGGPPCVRIRVRGQSFMLHQIRHMIGGGLAAARGMVPLQLLRASLAAPARVTVPRAPPHTLILADCSFPPFRKAGADEARVARWSGERLGLRQGGSDNLRAFRQECLDPALNDLVHHPDWSRFETSLRRFRWQPQAQQEVIAAHADWEAARQERARLRQLEKEREAEEAKKQAAAAAEAADAVVEETIAVAAEAVAALTMAAAGEGGK
ncbi:hypothetical protein Agub_g7817 [Astrephomene gubernaculifera]|uniref:Pseudouridine synthase I TruA alpha/beta domain-containing protein n=1 Tax=Astrephomene gubernaculifera TaxID=47775 RepID=A0AAD3HLZ2_9CHLO|nr:hypothetical protein Agub_g7817 [Astrephomene gubernaculifera]